jgi:hypothetical protein
VSIVWSWSGFVRVKGLSKTGSKNSLVFGVQYLLVNCNLMLPVIKALVVFRFYLGTGSLFGVMAVSTTILRLFSSHGIRTLCS